MTAQQFYELKSKVREYLDAKKVLPKIGGKRPGKKCGGSYIAADKKCKSHYSAEGKLTEAGKASAQELAGKVRARKNLKPLDKVSPVGDTKRKSSSKGKKKMSIQNAILTEQRSGHKVIPLGNKRVGVSGVQAVTEARKLEKAGKIKRFLNSSERTRIGNNYDGSWKYGMTWQGVVELL